MTIYRVFEKIKDGTYSLDTEFIVGPEAWKKAKDFKTRDRFVLSKGHASAALYCVLAEEGYFDKKELANQFNVEDIDNCMLGYIIHIFLHIIISPFPMAYISSAKGPHLSSAAN